MGSYSAGSLTYTKGHSGRHRNMKSMDESSWFMIPVNYFLNPGDSVEGSLIAKSSLLNENNPYNTTSTSEADTRRTLLYRAAQRRDEKVSILTKKQMSKESYSYVQTHIPTLPPSFFEYFQHVSVLKLSCGLKKLSPQIRNLRNLRSLDLRKNELASLPCQITSLNLLQIHVDDVLQPDYSELMLTDFVYQIPTSDKISITGTAESNRVYKEPKEFWDAPPSLREIVLRVIFKSVPLSDFDTPDIMPPLSYIPRHMRTQTYPPDICSECEQFLIESDSRAGIRTIVRYRKENVALRRLVVEHVFCSKRCLISAEERWRGEDIEEQLRYVQRGFRFVTEDGFFLSNDISRTTVSEA
ncbi:hypothetical protein V1511DRAFT_502911 [Dipodascopsis uninucleata]